MEAITLFEKGRGRENMILSRNLHSHPDESPFPAPRVETWIFDRLGTLGQLTLGQRRFGEK